MKILTIIMLLTHKFNNKLNNKIHSLITAVRENKIILVSIWIKLMRRKARKIANYPTIKRETSNYND